MPLIYKIIDSSQSTIAVWHVTESMEYLTDRLQLKNTPSNQQLSSMHPRRKLEWLASRNLICSLLGDFDVSKIKNDSFGKPYHNTIDVNISISHTVGYVAVYLSDKIIGIDIQQITPKIKAIAHKFLDYNSLHELHQTDNLNAIHYLWGAKECMYKCYGRKKLDFREHLKVSTGPLKLADENLIFPLTTFGLITKGLYHKEFNITGIKINEALLVYAHD
jgi:phosphopantetheinyl transferase